jgi:hypothetical protein
MNHHPCPTPFDALESAADELGVPLMMEKIAAQDTALSQIERIAAEECGKQPATASAMQACDLLHHAAREREEIGYLPPDTVNDAIGLARQARGHAGRVAEQRETPGTRAR